MTQQQPATLPVHPGLAVTTGLLCAHLVAAITITAVGPALRYERVAVSAGEWWRLITAGYAHTGTVHQGLNFAALGLILLSQGAATARLTLLCLPILSSGVYLTEHWVLDHSWAVGLSGAVHGAAVLSVLAPRPGIVAWMLPLAVSSKAMYEQCCGSNATTSAMIGTAVLSEHHVVGILWGWALAAAILGWHSFQHRRDRPRVRRCS